MLPGNSGHSIGLQFKLLFTLELVLFIYGLFGWLIPLFVWMYNGKKENMKIFVGADHNGFRLKEHIEHYLRSLNYDVKDVSGNKFDQDDDYLFTPQRLRLVF